MQWCLHIKESYNEDILLFIILLRLPKEDLFYNKCQICRKELNVFSS